MAYQVTRLRPASAAAQAGAPDVCPLLEQMPGVSRRYRWHDEEVHYRALGEGPAVVLVHAPDTGACCLEWRHNMEALAESGAVYAVDLPGYGLSEARPAAYTTDLYLRFLVDFLRAVAGTGARVVGSGLGASYLVHVADRHPELVDRLVLVAPAGLSAGRPRPMGTVTFALMGLPGVSNALYGATTSRCAIKEHLEREVYTDDRLVGPQIVDARYWVCRRPYSERVERSRMAGLQNTDIRGALKRLRQPVLVAWGMHAVSPPFSDTEIVRELNPQVGMITFERSGLCPHEEESGRFNKAAAAFLRTGGMTDIESV